MSSMKKKRRKKLAKEWAEFQGRHALSDDDAKLARSTGYSLVRIESMLEIGGLGKLPPWIAVHSSMEVVSNVEVQAEIKTKGKATSRITEAANKRFWREAVRTGASLFPRG